MFSSSGEDGAFSAFEAVFGASTSSPEIVPFPCVQLLCRTSVHGPASDEIREFALGILLFVTILVIVAPSVLQKSRMPQCIHECCEFAITLYEVWFAKVTQFRHVKHVQTAKEQGGSCETVGEFAFSIFIHVIVD